MAKGRFTRADMVTDDQRAAFDRAFGKFLPPPSKLTAKAGPHGGTGGGRKLTDRNKTEADYETWVAGRTSVEAVVAQAIRVTLPAEKATYRPDLLIRYAGPGCARVDDAIATGLIALDAVDVKGTQRQTGEPRYTQASWLRLKLAAQVLAPLGIRCLIAWRVKGVWRHRVVPTRDVGGVV